MQNERGHYRVSAVIPCLNEEQTLAICINKALEAFKQMNIEGEVVVADNGSTDASRDIAQQCGARVIEVPERGYGAALIAGIEGAKGDIVIMADADDSYDWANIEPFITKIDEGYDLVMGNRFAGGIEPGAMPALHKYIGNPILSAIARMTFKTDIRDFHCGMRAFRRAAISTLNLKSPGMEFATEMVANAVRNELKIAEIPIKLHVDKRDRPPHLRSFRDGWRHLRFIMLYAPDHLFLIPGMIMTLLGLTLVMCLAQGPITLFGGYIGIHFLALGGLLSIVGYNILWIGCFGKIIVATRFPTLTSPLITFIKTRFHLEAGLLAGGLLTLSGAAIDLAILYKWLSNPSEPMESTIHPAFAATTLIAIGLSTVFNSFLISLQKEFSKN